MESQIVLLPEINKKFKTFVIYTNYKHIKLSGSCNIMGQISDNSSFGIIEIDF